jgi:hypothetical protein
MEPHPISLDLWKICQLLRSLADASDAALAGEIDELEIARAGICELIARAQRAERKAA